MIKNITLSADEVLINQARHKAEQKKTSLNKLFREWISRYVNKDNISSNYNSLMESLSAVDSGGNSGKKLTRENMNER